MKKILPVFVLIFILGSVQLNKVFAEGENSLPSNDSSILPNEIEAKFTIYDLAIFDEIKKLIGSNYRNYRYKFWLKVLNVDDYYDTNDFKLYANDGVLRARTRYKDVTGDELNDIMFQAKDSVVGSIEEGVFSRNEVRGKSFHDQEKFFKHSKKSLNKNGVDKAVSFIRNFIASEDPLTPKVRVSDVRYYIGVYKKGAHHLIPEFQISLDQAEAINLENGEKKSFNELEIEIWDQIPFINRVTKERNKALYSFVNAIQKKFNLEASKESKFIRSMNLVVDFDRTNLAKTKKKTQKRRKKYEKYIKYDQLLEKLQKIETQKENGSRSILDSLTTKAFKVKEQKEKIKKFLKGQKKIFLKNYNLYKVKKKFSIKLGKKKEKIKINEAEIVSGETYMPEAISVNDNGTAIFWVGKEKNINSFPPRDIYYLDLEGNKEAERVYNGVLSVATGESFAHQTEKNELITIRSFDQFTAKSVFMTLFKNFRNLKKFKLKGFKNLIIIKNHTTGDQKILSYKELGVKKDDPLKHSKMSPDGKWLTFYTRNYEKMRGIHLHNLKTGRNFHLGNYDDKHPTWSPDGTKIIFHTQMGGNSFKDSKNGEEQAIIGYFDLIFDDHQNVKWKRFTLDSETNVKKFKYQKHATMLPKTNYIIYHGKYFPEGDSELYVRKLERGSKIFKLSIHDQKGLLLDKAKHPTISMKSGDLFFLGKNKKSDNPDRRYKIYRLINEKILKQIQSEVKE